MDNGMSKTKSIKEVQAMLEQVKTEMGASDFRGIFEENDQGMHDAAYSCIETAILLLDLALDDENEQNGVKNE